MKKGEVLLYLETPNTMDKTKKLRLINIWKKFVWYNKKKFF